MYLSEGRSTASGLCSVTRRANCSLRGQKCFDLTPEIALQADRSVCAGDDQDRKRPEKSTSWAFLLQRTVGNCAGFGHRPAYALSNTDHVPRCVTLDAGKKALYYWG